MQTMLPLAVKTMLALVGTGNRLPQYEAAFFANDDYTFKYMNHLLEDTAFSHILLGPTCHITDFRVALYMYMYTTHILKARWPVCEPRLSAAPLYYDVYKQSFILD